jgi:hypothetical protein
VYLPRLLHVVKASIHSRSTLLKLALPFAQDTALILRCHPHLLQLRHPIARGIQLILQRRHPALKHVKFLMIV